jgi:hypothetical protein
MTDTEFDQLVTDAAKTAESFARIDAGPFRRAEFEPSARADERR